MNNKKIFISLAAVIVVAAGIVGIAATSKKPETPIDSPVATPVADTPVADTSSSASSAKATADKQEYKDGTYTATGTYKSPGGIDNLGVSVTVKNDVASAVTVTPMPHDPTSAHYQSLFVSGYQSLVVGKKLDSINLSGSISGSSLTAIGFNDAIAQIKAQAKS